MHVIAIAGPSGAGKTYATMLVQDVLHDLKVVVLPLDAYYRDDVARGRYPGPDFDDPQMVDLALAAQHIDALRAGTGVCRPVYDFVRQRRTEKTVEVSGEADVVLVEGLFALHDAALRGRCDALAFVEERESVCLARRMQRDVKERGRTHASVLDRLDLINRGLDQFVLPSRAHATIVGNAPTVASGLVRAVLCDDARRAS